MSIDLNIPPILIITNKIIIDITRKAITKMILTWRAVTSFFSASAFSSCSFLSAVNNLDKVSSTLEMRAMMLVVWWSSSQCNQTYHHHILDTLLFIGGELIVIIIVIVIIVITITSSLADNNLVWATVSSASTDFFSSRTSVSWSLSWRNIYHDDKLQSYIFISVFDNPSPKVASCSPVQGFSPLSAGSVSLLARSQTVRPVTSKSWPCQARWSISSNLSYRI